MEKEDIIRLAAYTAATVVFLAVYNAVLSTNMFLRATDFRLCGSLCAVFTWLMLIMLDLTLTIGSFSNAWITVMAIALGLCVFGLGIYMTVEMSGWGLRGSLSAYAPSVVEKGKQAIYENVWLYGLVITPMIGGAVADVLIIWRLKDEQMPWWMCAVYAAAYFVGVIICWIFTNYVTAVMAILYIACGIGSAVLGFFTLKEVFF